MVEQLPVLEMHGLSTSAQAIPMFLSLCIINLETTQLMVLCQTTLLSTLATTITVLTIHSSVVARTVELMTFALLHPHLLKTLSL